MFHNVKIFLLSFVLSTTTIISSSANADEAMTVDIKRLKLETALRIAQAAIAQCRKEGVQIGVTVVDRGGHPQVMLRDVLAMDITVLIWYYIGVC